MGIKVVLSIVGMVAFQIAFAVVVMIVFVSLPGCPSRDNSTAEYESRSENAFHGNDCLGDCSGHQAGYDWAEDNDINDTGDCNGNSDSFSEGCESYVEENN